MGVYYPKVSVVLRVRWESFGNDSALREKVSDFPVLAKNVTVNINDYTQADTFTLEVEYKNFPFDPRTIRSVGVTIHMEDTGAVNKQIEPKTSNAVFMGFADEESISFDDTSRTVRMEGRDYTGLLVDRKYPNGTINVEKPVDEVIQGVLSSLSETEQIKLDNRVWSLGAARLPVLSKFWGEKDKLSGRINTKSNQTYWDVIQDIVSRAGLIAYFELDKLVLSKPRVLYEKKRAHIFVYGRNLSSLEFKRKVGRMKGFNVIVRSLNLNTKEIVEAKIPAEATSTWSKETGIPAVEAKIQTLKPDGTPVDLDKGSQPQAAPYMSFRVPDVTSKDHLITIGQEIYEELSRQQIEGSLETKDMAVPDGVLKSGTISGVQRGDLLKLRVGTPIQIEIEQGDLQGLSKFSSKESRASFLKRRGYEAAVADSFAQSMDMMARQEVKFYTKAVTYSMSAEQGFDCKVEFLNFIELPKALGGSA